MLIGYRLADGFIQQTVHDPVDMTYVERMQNVGLGVVRVPDDFVPEVDLFSRYVDLASLPQHLAEATALEANSLPVPEPYTIVREDGSQDVVIPPMPEGFRVTRLVGSTEVMISDQQYADHLESVATVVRQREAIEFELSSTAVIADGESTISITGLPAPCTVFVDDTSYDVEDGHFDFAAEDPGEYLITVRAWPFLDTSFSITARAS
ncbi:hypothetical protein [Mangrovibrevibacter kandeliae]|uniref:hypothetical protein n=1 Tax=Mangrovibrevibacter kandeliae TaxID=2968473 RepID=UPI0021196666|nr:hypothetical protein [Aurantimonas sp. CSK15Z-1]MCQ8781734.1 hypothetical protein [Aurantimonas sp. CSK15Z-1]